MSSFEFNIEEGYLDVQNNSENNNKCKHFFNKCKQSCNFDTNIRLISLFVITSIFSWILYISLEYKYQKFEGIVISSKIYNNSIDEYFLNLYAANNEKKINNYCEYANYYVGSYNSAINVSKNMTSEKIKWLIYDYNKCSEFDKNKLNTLDYDSFLTICGFILFILTDTLLFFSVERYDLTNLIILHTSIIFIFKNCLIE